MTRNRNVTVSFKRCQLINPTDPDRLCTLEHGHAGTAEGVHHLIGHERPERVTPACFVREGRTMSDRTLVHLGHDARDAHGYDRVPTAGTPA